MTSSPCAASPSPSLVAWTTPVASAAAWQEVAVARQQVEPLWHELDEVVRFNQARVLEAFWRAGVSQDMLGGSTGYGYNDAGRQALEAVYASYFQAEAALVRPQLVSGTHALACALYGLLRPGDELVTVGRPYDTLATLIGLGPGDHAGTLIDSGVRYREVPWDSPQLVDVDAVLRQLSDSTRVLFLQRSRGYSRRPSLSMEAMAELIAAARQRAPQVKVVVDNCYGEFVETREPSMVGADLVAGSLIKNPGGGLAVTGGYIVGRRECVEAAARRLFAPGLGREVGPLLDLARSLFQGFFLAPHIVGEAVRGALLAAAFFAARGWPVAPGPQERRTDLIQTIDFPDAASLLTAARVLQAASPVDSQATPEPAPMPGYPDPVVMAAGTFVQGASLELSADAPLRPPFTLYWQGGLTREHVEVALARMAASLPGHNNKMPG